MNTERIVARVCALANKCGLEGMRVNIVYIPPQSGSDNPDSGLAIEVLPHLSGADNEDKGRG